MKTTPFDKLRTAKPINKQAGMIFAGGINYDRKRHELEKHWEAPPPTFKFVPQANNPQSIDFTGRKVGRLMVIGYLGAVGNSYGRNKNRQGAWLVRCVCGRYEQRTARAIRNPENAVDCCLDCRNLEHLKGQRGDDWHRRPK